MSKKVIDGVLKEDLWKLMEEKIKGEVGEEKSREVFNEVYETAQTHLLDVMREIYKNDITLFTEFFG